MKWIAMLACLFSVADDSDLVRIRAMMADNLQRLPNYTCQMVIERSARGIALASPLKPVDTLRLDVAYVGGKELVAVPGSPLGQRSISQIANGGMASSGYFADLAIAVFGSDGAVIHKVGSTKLDDRDAVQYAYEIPKRVSHYVVRSGSKSVTVPYHGSFWADASTLELIRMDARIEDFPREMGLASDTTIVDYRKAHIGDSDFLLPNRVEKTARNLDSSMRVNVTQYTSCKEYKSETTIRFDLP